MDTASEDLFALFEIDLECDDPAAIDAAITRKQKEWSSKRNDLRRGQEYANRLEQIQTYRSVLSDLEARAKHRQEVRARRQREVGRRVAAARAALRPLTAEQSITSDALGQFIKEFAHPAGPTEDDLRDMVKVPVVEADAGDDDQRGPLMPTTLYDEVRGHLDVLGQADLYEFLNVPPDASDADIRRHKSMLQEQWKGKPASTELSAANKLDGIIGRHLLDPAKRDAYDNSLSDERAEPFLKALRPLLSTGSVSAAQVEAIISVAADCKIEREAALRIIRSEARKSGTALTVSDAVKAQRICGKCRYPNQHAATSCRDCGAPLDIECPSCGTTVATSEGACAKCRMPMARILSLPDELKSLRALLSGGQVTEASTKAREALAHYGNKCGAILEVVEEANKRYELAQAKLGDARTAYHTRKLHMARDLVNGALATDRSYPGASELSEQVAHDLKRSESLIAEAKEAEARGAREDAAEGYLRALALCADADGAARGLDRLPPAPPEQLRAEADGRKIRLQWPKSPSTGVEQYVVLRRTGGAPSSVSDGTEIARVSDLSYDDLSAPIGTTCQYGVFALRGETASPQGASSSPVTAIAEVSDLVASADDGVVEISWDLPGEVVTVEACRREDRPPESIEDGQGLRLRNNNSLSDTEVQNGVTYYYRVNCVYQGANGRMIRSSGAVVSAKPEPLPLPLEALDVRSDDGEVIVSWPPPEFGDVCVVCHDEPLAIQPGTAVPRARIADLGSVVKRSGPATARGPRPNESIQYYTAVTLGAQMAVVGITERFVNLAEAVGARLESNAGQLQAYWKWPPSTTFAKVGWRTDEHPSSPEDPNASFRRITKAEFDRDGRCTIPNPPEGECYVSVFVGMATPEGEIFAGASGTGARAIHHSGPTVSVFYQIHKSFFGRKRTLVLTASSPCILPSAVLVSSPNNLPMDINSGSMVQDFPDMKLGTDEVQIPLELPSSRYYVKLFLKDAAAYSRLIINHPPKDTLRIA